jgi:hypothetical protein
MNKELEYRKLHLHDQKKKEANAPQEKQTQPPLSPSFGALWVAHPTIFSRMSCDGLSTTVSSYELFFRAVGFVEGRTTVVAFFGLSSSLEENYSSSRTREDQNKENSWKQ